MHSTLSNVHEIANCDIESLSEHLTALDKPIVFKGLVSDWPIVKAASQSFESVADYLLSLSQPMQVGVGQIPKQHNGRLFYNDDFSGFNFSRCSEEFTHFISTVVSAINDDTSDGHYMGSTPVDRLMPEFRKLNDIGSIREKSPLTSIWISNKTQIAAHQDLPENLACCVAGKRRFTLFPPDQIDNLYIGPIDLTPAGQPISLVNLNKPDLAKFPKFSTALEHAQVAELEAGDVLFIPSMWWHNVESLAAFNVLINYWWQEKPTQHGAPVDALVHAIMNTSGLTKNQKKALQQLFNFYVFNDDEQALQHIPKSALGILDNDSALSARKMRAMLLNKLNR